MKMLLQCWAKSIVTAKWWQKLCSDPWPYWLFPFLCRNFDQSYWSSKKYHIFFFKRETSFYFNLILFIKLSELIRTTDYPPCSLGQLADCHKNCRIMPSCWANTLKVEQILDTHTQGHRRLLNQRKMPSLHGEAAAFSPHQLILICDIAATIGSALC